MTGRLPEDHSSRKHLMQREFTAEELRRLCARINVSIVVAKSNDDESSIEIQNKEQKKEEADGFVDSLTNYLNNPPDGGITLEKLGKFVQDRIDHNNEYIHGCALLFFDGIIVDILFPGEKNERTREVVRDELIQYFQDKRDLGGPGSGPGSSN